MDWKAPCRWVGYLLVTLHIRFEFGSLLLNASVGDVLVFVGTPLLWVAVWELIVAMEAEKRQKKKKAAVVDGTNTPKNPVRSRSRVSSGVVRFGRRSSWSCLRLS